MFEVKNFNLEHMFEDESFFLGTCSEDENFSLEHGRGGGVLDGVGWGGAFLWGVWAICGCVWAGLCVWWCGLRWCMGGVWGHRCLPAIEVATPL